MKVICRKCKHYFVTWDKDKPHGCRILGFKSRQAPSLVVRQATPGLQCQYFKPRSRKVPGDQK
ncbi:MAG: hypothetical protein [Olavius algarvensis Delta 4 endosymbiont]|nr:MAG: hypothetical protein [Olavius algarvensis Delta 4 endosymbiont]